MRGLKRWLRTALPILALLAIKGSYAAPVQAASPPAGAGWQVLFAAGGADGLWDGPFRAANEAVIARILALAGALGDTPGLRFIFVAERNGICRGKPDCQADRLLWERVTAVTGRLRELTRNTAGTGFERIGSAFDDELTERPTLKPTPPGSEALHVVVHVDGRATRADSCFGRVTLTDPDLPPVVGSTGEAGALPLPDGLLLPLGSKARLDIRVDAAQAGAAHLFWENDRREFRRAGAGLASGSAVFADGRPATLHLMITDHPDKAVRRFLAALTETYAPVAELPRFLGGETEAPGGRAVGDHVEAFEPGMLHQPRHCRYRFKPASTADMYSSR